MYVLLVLLNALPFNRIEIIIITNKYKYYIIVFCWENFEITDYNLNWVYIN